jgi:hypothetical protein
MSEYLGDDSSGVQQISGGMCVSPCYYPDEDLTLLSCCHQNSRYMGIYAPRNPSLSAIGCRQPHVDFRSVRQRRDRRIRASGE